MKTLCFLLILALTISLCACHSIEDSKKYISISESQNSLHYIVSSHNYEELHNAIVSQPSIDELHKSISIDFVKITASGYETVFQTEKGFILVGFDSNRVYSYTKEIHFSQGVSEASFANITQGMPLSEIHKIDPHGDYSFLYASVSGIPAISHHYFESGTHYTIYYDDKFCVTNIDKTLI